MIRKLLASKRSTEQEEVVIAVNSYQRREWLNPVESVLETSYVMGVVTSSYEGQFLHGLNELFLADNLHVVRIEFFLGSPQAREASMKKIDLLLSVVREFREQLVIEAGAIQRREEAAK